ncbi:hypothetical protein AB0K74_44885, partial [Streptomyces sp. NPDC056159]
TLDEDHDDQEIARWVTVHPPISGQFSPVAETIGGMSLLLRLLTAADDGHEAVLSSAGRVGFRRR